MIDGLHDEGAPRAPVAPDLASWEAFERLCAAGPLTSVARALQTLGARHHPGFELLWLPLVLDGFLRERMGWVCPLLAVGSAAFLFPACLSEEYPAEVRAVWWAWANLVACTDPQCRRLFDLLPSNLRGRVEANAALEGWRFRPVDWPLFRRGVACSLVYDPFTEGRGSIARQRLYRLPDAEQLAGAILQRSAPYVDPLNPEAGPRLLVLLATDQRTLPLLVAADAAVRGRPAEIARVIADGTQARSEQRDGAIRGYLLRAIALGFSQERLAQEMQEEGDWVSVDAALKAVRRCYARLKQQRPELGPWGSWDRDPPA